ncbi:MAG: thioredoxin [Rhizobiaceae bacterium]
MNNDDQYGTGQNGGQNSGQNSGIGMQYTQSAGQSANVSYGTPNPAPAHTHTHAHATASGPIKDISTAEFGPEVIEASKVQPVLVDFWAPWCGPCKQLAPVLERVVAETQGAVKLVKMNIDDHPEIPGQMGVQSIPAVVAFKDGRPAEAFMGVKPESEIRAFIQKISGATGPSELDLALEQAEKLREEGVDLEAAQIYASILQQFPDNLASIIGLGSIYLDGGDLEKATEMLEMVPEESRKDASFSSLKAAIELAGQAGDLGELAELEATLAKNPKDHQARFDLAIALSAANRRDEAADHLLEIIGTDRKWQDDGAKTQLLQFFEAWGMMDEATLAARRKLSSMLFS